MNALTTSLNPEVIRKLFLPALATLSKDAVPNIRMNVAKTIQNMYHQIHGSGDLEDKLKAILRDLSNDTDMDVKFYALRALQTNT